MTEKKVAEFPKVNFVALLSGAIFLVSIFLYWWGLDATGSFGIADSLRWTLWAGPPANSIASSAQPSQTLATYSPIVGVLVITAAVLVLVGMIPKASRLLIGSVILSIIAPVLYAVLVNYSISNACNGASFCISGPFGTETRTVGPLSLTLTWGFQPGFYLSIVGAVLSFISVAFHRTYLRRK
jgi:apolipoprotein N-acyltransferase